MKIICVLHKKTCTFVWLFFRLLLAPILIEHFGWEYVFYTFGILGIIWYVLFSVLIFVSSLMLLEKREEIIIWIPEYDQCQ